MPCGEGGNRGQVQFLSNKLDLSPFPSPFPCFCSNPKWPTNSAGIVADDRIRCTLYCCRADLRRRRSPSDNQHAQIKYRTAEPQIQEKCSTMPQPADTQRLNTCSSPASVAAARMPVKCRSVSLTAVPPTPYDAAGRVHGSLRKSKGGLNFVLSPIRKRPPRRNPLSHNTFRQTATPSNREMSIMEQKTDRHPGCPRRWNVRESARQTRPREHRSALQKTHLR